MHFALSPLTNGCAVITTQTKDIDSLIFDLSACDRTNFAYYQIKNYRNFEEMDANLQGGKKSIVDAYESPYSLEWFISKRVLTPYLVGVFFNTDSEKMKVRLRRSLGGLINANFHTWASDQYLQPYEGWLFSLFHSEGETIKDLINRVSLEDDNSVDELDLKESGAKELPNGITINGVDRKFLFFSQKPTEWRTLDISFNNAFDSIKIIAPNGQVFTPKNYKPSDKKVSYKLTLGENLVIGANQYIIQWTVKGKTYVIASIDLYVFEQMKTQNTGDQQWKLNVLYFSDPVSTFVAQQLRTLFKNAGILEYFLFEEVYNSEELEGKLLMKSYDLYIGTVDLGTKKSLLSLFFTDDVLLNPSAYKNPILSSLIKQYALNANKTVEEQINNLLAQDMPVVLLWYKFTLLQLQSKIVNEVFSGVDFLQANQWRNQIYTQYSLLHARRIDPEKALSFENFVDFLVGNLSTGDSKFISSLVTE